MMNAFVPMILSWMAGSLPASIVAAPPAGLTDTLYIARPNNVHAAIGSSLVWTTPTNDTSYAVAVWSDIRTYGMYFPETGRQLNLSGTPTGTTYFNPGPMINLLDGTSDGTYNYASSYWMESKVYRCDRNWNNCQSFFTVPELESTGVTYDPTSSTFWTISSPSGQMSLLRHWSNTGSPLGSVPLATGENYGLAWEPSTGTLWTSVSGSNHFRKFSTSGALLNEISIPGTGSFNYGLEFNLAAAPEPGTLGLLTLGGVFLVRRQRRIASR